MLPYLGHVQFHLFGPFTLYPFGLLVATGVLVGHWFVNLRAKEAGVPRAEMDQAVLFSLLFGFVGAHVFDVIFYYPERISQEGVVTLLKIWDGISSFGGIFGALLGLLVFRIRMKRSTLVHMDILLQGFVIGWIFGRLGCTIAFDHPGNPSDFFLAFDHPQGPRHNLGFYEFLYTVIVLAPAMFWLHARKPKPKPGMYMGVAAILYAPVRFGLDFLRTQEGHAADPRYGGLTAAQWSCFLLIAVGIWLVMLPNRSNKPARARTRS